MQPSVLIVALVAEGLSSPVFSNRRFKTVAPPVARLTPQVVAAVVIALVAQRAIAAFPSRDQSNNSIAYLHGTNDCSALIFGGKRVLDALPKNAILLAMADQNTNPVRYVQACEKLRAKRI
jgi:hypothetical protein